MRYLVRVEPEWKAADTLDSQPGGPGGLFKLVGERFKPDTFFVEAGRRAAFWIVDFPDGPALTAFTHLMVARCGAYPTFTPILSASEAPGAIGAAIEQARQG